jgi:hypothetical protein
VPDENCAGIVGPGRNEKEFKKVFRHFAAFWANSLKW